MKKYNFRRIESEYCGKHLVSERWQTQLQKGTNQVTAKVFIIDSGQVAFIQENEAYYEPDLCDRGIDYLEFLIDEKLGNYEYEKVTA